MTREELSDPRLDIKHIDGRRYIRLAEYSGSGERYDLVILNLPMPSTLQLNRFYTKEFFQNVRAVLAEDGIFAFGANAREAGYTLLRYLFMAKKLASSQ